MSRYNLFSINYMPLIIRLKCCETASLPAYLGSMLHGIIGWALKNDKEAYHYIFENGKRPDDGQVTVNPYFLEVPGYKNVYCPGDELRFGFVLLGDAVRYTGNLIEALVKTREFGLGAERKKFELMEIMQESRLEVMWESNNSDKIKFAGGEVLLDEMQRDCSQCAIMLQTPLRIRRKGALLTEIDLPVIIRNITRRITELSERYGGFVNVDEAGRACIFAEQIQETTCRFSVSTIERYSNRHGMKMDMSGVMGTMTCEGELEPLTPWLNAARVLHIGRNVTFGYGKVNVVFW